MIESHFYRILVSHQFTIHASFPIMSYAYAPQCEKEPRSTVLFTVNPAPCEQFNTLIGNKQISTPFKLIFDFRTCVPPKKAFFQRSLTSSISLNVIALTSERFTFSNVYN